MSVTNAVITAETLLVAPVDMFKPVLTKTAVTGKDHTSQETIFAKALPNNSVDLEKEIPVF